MTVKIGSNVASLTAQRRLGEADSALSKTFERLSSGQRINRASDDAAGLAISDDLKAKSRIYTQGIRNGNDGISLLNIADSAIAALSTVVSRIRELSEQSANGTYSSTQRQALDNEAQALSKEFTRITQTTSFNGIKIFNGSLGDGVRLQLGVGISESINASVGGNIGTGTFSGINSFSTDDYRSMDVALGDVNGDGILDLVTAGYSNVGGKHGTATIKLGDGAGNFYEASSFTMDSTNSSSISLGDLNGDGILDLVTAGYSNIGGYHGTATVRLGTGNGSFGATSSFTADPSTSFAVSLGDLNGDGVLDMVTTGFYDDGDLIRYGTATVRLGLGNGNFGDSSTFTTEGVHSNALSLGDLNGDGILDLVTTGYSDDGGYYGSATVRLGTGNGSFGAATSFTTDANTSFALSLSDLNGDEILDLVTAGYSGIGGTHGTATVRLGLGNGSFSEVYSYSTEKYMSLSISIGDLNGDGIPDMVTGGDTQIVGANTSTTVKLGIGNGNFSQSFTYTANISSQALSLGDLNGDGVLDIITIGSLWDGNSKGTATVRLAQTEDGLGAMLQFSLKTNSDALQSMGMLDRTLENLAKQRGTIGASQSRIGIALSNLQTATENFKAAESRIRDADVAAEAANLVRTQILQQAAASVLSQANQAPQLALTLLR